jgi:Zn-dependent peptidase ImmA (M78 family)
MTIAHELGHVIFHNILFQLEQGFELFLNMQKTAPTYCKRSTIVRGGDWMEWQASYAAGAILIPIKTLRKVVEESRQELQMSGALPYDDPRSNSLSAIVCEAFDVSGEAAKVRLLQTGHIEPKGVLSLPLRLETVPGLEI